MFYYLCSHSQVLAFLEMKDWLVDEDKLTHLRKLYPSDAIKKGPRRLVNFAHQLERIQLQMDYLQFNKSVAEFIEKGTDSLVILIQFT